MSLNVFPTLQGQAWPVNRKPTFKTKIQQTWSGRELRAQQWAYPIWQFTIAYDYLPTADLQTLAAFYMARGGAFDEFLFQDAHDKTATNVTIGTGDGSTKLFPLVSSFGTYLQPIGCLNGNPTSVKVNGVSKTLTTDYTLTGTNGYAGNNALNFVTAPGAGQAITASFSFYYRVRFMADDSCDLSEFVNNVYELQQLDLIGFRP